MIVPFHFGIPGIDELVAGGEPAVNETNDIHPWTGAIIGPDGCGKSILSLILASEYWHAHSFHNPVTRILYVSTDLSYSQAKTQWRNFGCDHPVDRAHAIATAYKRSVDHPFIPSDGKKGVECGLIPIDPRKDSDIEMFVGDNSVGGVAFLDLHSQTTGDDWGFLNRLLGLLNRQVDPKHRHLVILDAIEGLESLVGEFDAYGMRRNRRSRVNQFTRNAIEAEAHLLVIVEEAKRNVRLPEQFITDLVLRLRSRRDGDYSQRTIEVEKCRATAHIRGEHELGIRRGIGTRTGVDSHIDDPEVTWPLDEKDSNGSWKMTYLAHIHIIKSLHLWNRHVREEVATLPELVGSPKFLELPELGQMLKVAAHNVTKPEKQVEGSFSFILGDAGTHKTVLADHFLAAAFVGPENAFAPTKGVAVLVTSGLTDGDMLARRLAGHLFEAGLTTNHSTEAQYFADIKDRVLCRRMAVRHMSSATFHSIVACYVREAQIKGEIDITQSIERRRQKSHNIHFVLEDWNQLLSTHPGFADDPLLLQSLLGTLKREGLSSIVVSTQPGQPTLPETMLQQNDLRKLDENQIFTWSVPFFGERRVAVTAFPARAAKARPVIYELDIGTSDPRRRLSAECPCGATINRRFALYSDVDRGAPKRVPLSVRLYEGNHPTGSEQSEQPAYARMLHDTLSQVFPNAPPGAGTISFESYANYDAMFAFADNLDDSQLEHSLIYQIDEYWSIGKNSLADLTAYWNGTVARLEKDGKYSTNRDEDPFAMNQPHPPIERTKPCSRLGDGQIDLVPQITNRPFDQEANETRRPGGIRGPGSYQRKHMFIGAEDGGPKDNKEKYVVDRIPYLWDFGMIVTRRDVWYRYRDNEIYRDLKDSTRDAGHKQWSISDVWDALCLPNAGMTGGSTFKYVPWDVFLTACKHIAERENLTPFTFDQSTPETLHCLILEMWMSFEWSLHVLRSKEKPEERLIWLWDRGAEKPTTTLRELLKKKRLSLFLAMQWLVKSCGDSLHFNSASAVTGPIRRALVSREWYHTASAIMKVDEAEQDWEVLAVPGRFACRGDWNLAIARGSRSVLLAQHAADLLTSRRLNLLRLHDGIGLPVRDIAPDAEIGNIKTALTSRQYIDEWRRGRVSYRDLCSLGSLNRSSPGKKFEFHWLWRSHIKDYDRSVFYWRAWIAEMLREQHTWALKQTELSKCHEAVENAYKSRELDHEDWTNEMGQLSVEENPASKEHFRFREFCARLDTLCAMLRS